MSNKPRPWTEEEVNTLMSGLHTDDELVELLGRTKYAICSKRYDVLHKED